MTRPPRQQQRRRAEPQRDPRPPRQEFGSRASVGSKSGLPSLQLPSALAASLSEGHPWIYRDHVPHGLQLESGSWVHLRAGSFEGYALWDASSPIALRVFSRSAPPDAAWFRARVQEAVSGRAELRASGTSAYRLLYGEGDGIPGVTIDVYGAHAVVATYADSVERLVPQVLAALEQHLPLDGVLQRRRPVQAKPGGRSGEGPVQAKPGGRSGEGPVQATGSEHEPRLTLISGTPPPEPLIVSERGVRLIAELESGQKTGLFLDHRENRVFVRERSAGRSVLNLFSYNGAFSVYAALGGARAVTSVDISRGAMAAARTNFELNQLPAELHEPLVADVFEFLSANPRSARYDIVICDPPSFAASASKQFAALRAYVRLHTLALARVELGGLYVAASCTAQVSPEAFRQTLAQAAARTRVRLQIVHDIGQPADHPVFAGHPEGRYLKFVVCRVLPQA